MKTLEHLRPNDTDIAKLVKEIGLKKWVNDWVNKHEGKIPLTFIPYEEFSEFVSKEAKKFFGGVKRFMEVWEEYKGPLSNLVYHHYCFSLTKTEIEINKLVLTELIKTPTQDKFPARVLTKLPYWSFSVCLLDRLSIDIDEHDIEGSVYWDVTFTIGSVKGDPVLFIRTNFATKRCEKLSELTWWVSLTTDTIEEALNKYPEENTNFNGGGDALNNSNITVVKTLLPIALYIASQQTQKEAGVNSRLEPSSHLKRKGRNWILKAAPKKRVVEYGNELQEELERFNTELKQSREFKGRIPHIRKAHWHGYWTGPRDGERNYIHHWIPPVIVSGMKGEEE